MNQQNTTYLYPWTADSLLEIILDEPDSFLKIKETLTRIGIASKRDNTLFQSCHILHKRGHYYCVHFKELFQVDGKQSDITHEDIGRRNTIAALLQQWGLCTVKPSDVDEYEGNMVQSSLIKIIPYRDKKNWNLVAKYKMRSERVPKEPQILNE